MSANDPDSRDPKPHAQVIREAKRTLTRVAHAAQQISQLEELMPEDLQRLAALVADLAEAVTGLLDER